MTTLDCDQAFPLLVAFGGRTEREERYRGRWGCDENGSIVCLVLFLAASSLTVFTKGKEAQVLLDFVYTCLGSRWLPLAPIHERRKGLPTDFIFLYVLMFCWSLFCW